MKTLEELINLRNQCELEIKELRKSEHAKEIAKLKEKTCGKVRCRRCKTLVNWWDCCDCGRRRWQEIEAEHENLREWGNEPLGTVYQEWLSTDWSEYSE